MSGNLSDYLNDDCFPLAPSEYPISYDESDNWSNESTNSLDGDSEPSSLNTSRHASPQELWHASPLRIESPPSGFMAKQFVPRLSECMRIHNISELLAPVEADYTMEFQDSCMMPPVPTLSPSTDYPSDPLPSAYLCSPISATTAGIEVAMPRPSKHYQPILAERFAAGTPSAPSPAPEMYLGTVAQVPGYANEPLVIENTLAGPSVAPTESVTASAAPLPPVAGPSTKPTNRKRRADSAGSDSSLSPADRKKSRKIYDDALLAASHGPPGTKNYPKRLATPYQAFLDQLVLPVLKRISEPTKWLVVGGQRSPAFGKLLWERVDEDVKKAWFDKMNDMREEWNKTAPEKAQCPVQLKPKPETLPKIGKSYQEVLGHIEPLVIAFFAGVEKMSDLMPGGQPNIDQDAMERAAQGKADVLGFGDDAKGGPLKGGVKPPGTILMGPSTVAKAGATNSDYAQSERPVKPLPKPRIAKNSRQALAENLVPVPPGATRPFRCGYVAGGNGDRNM